MSRAAVLHIPKWCLTVFPTRRTTLGRSHISLGEVHGGSQRRMMSPNTHLGQECVLSPYCDES